MGATLANGSVNPVTGEQAIETHYCKRPLPVPRYVGSGLNLSLISLSCGERSRAGVDGARCPDA
jgi:hypothetical protein